MAGCLNNEVKPYGPEAFSGVPSESSPDEKGVITLLQEFVQTSPSRPVKGLGKTYIKVVELAEFDSKTCAQRALNLQHQAPAKLNWKCRMSGQMKSVLAVGCLALGETLAA